MNRQLIPLLLVLVLGGCAPLGSPGGRVVLLVLVPAVLIVALLLLLRRRNRTRRIGRGPHYPDCDERE